MATIILAPPPESERSARAGRQSLGQPIAQTAEATGMTPALRWTALVETAAGPATPPAVFGPPMISAAGNPATWPAIPWPAQALTAGIPATSPAILWTALVQTAAGPATSPALFWTTRPADRRKHSRRTPSARACRVGCVVCPPNLSPVRCLAAARTGTMVARRLADYRRGRRRPTHPSTPPPCTPRLSPAASQLPGTLIIRPQGGAGKAKTSRRTRGLPG